MLDPNQLGMRSQIQVEYLNHNKEIGQVYIATLYIHVHVTIIV